MMNLFGTNLILLSYTLTLLISISNSLYFPLSVWKNYHLDHPHLLFSHSQNPFTIELPSRQTIDYHSQYYYSEEKLLIQFNHSQSNLKILSLNESVIISGLNDNQKIVISKDMMQDKELKLIFMKNFSTVAIHIQQESQSQKITISGHYDMLLFGKQEVISKQQWQSTQGASRKAAAIKLFSWLKKMSIPQHLLLFASKMHSQTISMLCKEQTHIGLCDLAHYGTKHARHQIDIRHSFLLMDMLHAQFPKMSLFLFQHMINLLEDRLFYEQGHLPFVPIPEDLNIFKAYYSAVKKQGPQINELSIRVKAVLNGLMNQMLLSDVNTLEQEINYRQNKKFHPSLFKMLSMNWKATSSKKAVSSIYQESFTPDYFYNFPNQTIDTCVSKVAWLGYATNEYNTLIREIGDQLDEAAKEQSESLFKVVKYVMNADTQAQQGRFYSINSIGGGIRVHSKQIGYESVLPYIYGITTVFPQGMLSNITTKYGLASLNLGHSRVNTHYEYRGNIHIYFNYKLLFQARRLLVQDGQKNVQNIKLINEVILSVRQFIGKEWKEGRSFTMWSAEGVGLRNKKQLSILNIGFFRSK